MPKIKVKYLLPENADVKGFKCKIFWLIFFQWRQRSNIFSDFQKQQLAKSAWIALQTTESPKQDYGLLFYANGALPPLLSRTVVLREWSPAPTPSSPENPHWRQYISKKAWRIYCMWGNSLIGLTSRCPILRYVFTYLEQITPNMKLKNTLLPMAI